MTRAAVAGVALAAAALALAPVAAGAGEDALAQWPQWRGPLGTGEAPRGDPPIAWSETENVRWKVPVPGRGLSTPIVWGDRVFLTTAIPVGEAQEGYAERDPGAHDNVPPRRRQEFAVLALNRSDGSVRWRRTVRTERPHEGTHVTGSWASQSPATDGERLYVSFGSRGLYALSLDGEVLWQRDLGDLTTRHGHGEGSSPALHDGTLVVNWDHQGDSFLVALDASTGAERWRTPRDEITSWSTPLVVEHAGRAQVIVAATRRVAAYDLADGSLIWECGGLSRNVVASPVAANGIVYVANSYDWQAMLAIRLAGARGDITGTDRVAWTLDRHTPYVASPLLAAGKLFFLKHLQGFLSAVDAATGRVLFGPQRLPEIRSVFASPVAAGDRLYVPSRSGATAVLRLAAEYEVLALNRLDDSFSASPAIAGDELYLRGLENLYCLARRTDTRPDPGG